MGKLSMLPNGPLQEGRDIKLRVKTAPSAGYPFVLMDPVFQDWLYGFDGRKEASEAWDRIEKTER